MGDLSAAKARLLAYAKELEIRDYHADLAAWRVQYHNLMMTKPQPPQGYEPDEEDWT